MNYIGLVIKKMRKNRNLSQTELADGICSFKQIYRIESCLSSPSACLVSEISYKLGSALLEYLPYSSDENVYEIKRLIDELHLLFEKHDHQKMYNIITSSSILNNSDCILVQQEIEWMLGAMTNYIDIPIKVDVGYYVNILRKNRDFVEIEDIFSSMLKPIEYRILNSIIVIKLKEEDFNCAKKLLLACIQNFEQYDARSSNSFYPRFLYNLSRLYFYQHNIESAIKYSTKGIDHCIQNNSIAYLADLYNICGKATYHLGLVEKGRELLMNYINLRRIYKPGLNYYDTIENLIKNYCLNT